MDNLLTTLFQIKCTVCGRYTGPICKLCLEKVQVLESPQVPLIKSPIQVLSAFEYEGIVRIVIKKSKYNSKVFSALRVLSKLGAVYLEKYGCVFPKDFTIIPIPLNNAKLKIRGFNQAEIVASEFSKVWGLKMDCKILKRIVNTDAQFKFSKAERIKNLTGAFEAKGALGKNILLVDDICTTGATLTNAYKALKGAGASKVIAVTLSFVV